MCSYLAIAFNLIIVVADVVAISSVRDKRDLVKYYTFLSNILLLLTSAVFVGVSLVGMSEPWVHIMRYIATASITFTMLVVIFFLAPKNDKGDDMMGGAFKRISAKTGNIIVHYLCPILSIVSFVFFEKGMALTSECVLYAAIPSIIYWVVYIVLTVTKKWEEPYGFFANDAADGSMIRNVAAPVIVTMAFIVCEILLLLAANAGLAISI